MIWKKVYCDSGFGNFFACNQQRQTFAFPKYNLAVYLDGEEVHRKRGEKDAMLRELLTKRFGIRMLYSEPRIEHFSLNY